MAGRRIVVVLACALALAAPSAASLRVNQPPPEVVAATKVCQDKGLKGGTPEFNQCLNQQLNAGKPAPPSGGVETPVAVIDACKAKGLTPGTSDFGKCVGASAPNAGKTGTPAQQAAIAACKAKGLVENSADFQQCIKEQTATGPALTPAQQAATDACKAKGITQLTAAFKQCVLDESEAAANKALTPKQLAAVDACKAKGLGTRSDAFGRCIEQQLSSVIKSQRPDAQVEIATAIAFCNKKILKTPDDARACLKAQLNK
jgi:hypothetical protein